MYARTSKNLCIHVCSHKRNIFSYITGRQIDRQIQTQIDVDTVAVAYVDADTDTDKKNNSYAKMTTELEPGPKPEPESETEERQRQGQICYLKAEIELNDKSMIFEMCQLFT